MTVQCCICKKVKEENTWVGRVPHVPREVSHTYCPQCLELSKAAMVREMAPTRNTTPALAVP